MTTAPVHPAEPVHPAFGPFKAVGWTVLFLIAGFVLTIVLAAGAFALTGGLTQGGAAPRALVIQTAAGLVGFGAATWAIGIRVLGLTWYDLRWQPVGLAGRGVALGLVLGAMPAVLALGLSVPLGGARFLPDSGGPLAYLGEVGRTGLILAPAALVEELMFRGVGQVLLARAFGRVPAILALSVVFALAHYFNPNTTTLGLVNIALAGVFLGIAFYAPGGIWCAWGAHLGWNVTLAALDAPVSGLPFRIPWIDYRPGGPAWLTGGSFGPEGGLLATLAIALATVGAWHWSRRETA